MNKIGGGEERWGMWDRQKTGSAKGNNQYIFSPKTGSFFFLTSDSQLVAKLVCLISAVPSLSLPSPRPLLCWVSPLLPLHSPILICFFLTSSCLRQSFSCTLFPLQSILHILVRVLFSHQHSSTRNNVSAPAQKSSAAPLPIKPSPNLSLSQLRSAS